MVGLFACLACAPPRANTAVRPVPAGLDSVQVAGWLAAERRVCRGQFEALYDEGAVAQGTSPDSASVFRYFRRVTGVRCTSSE